MAVFTLTTVSYNLSLQRQRLVTTICNSFLDGEWLTRACTLFGAATQLRPIVTPCAKKRYRKWVSILDVPSKVAKSSEPSLENVAEVSQPVKLVSFET